MSRLLELGGAVAAVGAALTAWGAARVRRRVPVVLALLARSSGAPIRATSVAMLTGIPLHSVHSMLRYMEAEGWVTAEEWPGRYGRGGRPAYGYRITIAGRGRLTDLNDAAPTTKG